MKLYEIPAEIDAIEQELIDNEGEITPELEARWQAIMIQGFDKIEGAAMVVRAIEASQKSCKEEAKRLTERAKRHERNAERLQSLMIYAVNAVGKPREKDGELKGHNVKTSLFSIRTQRSAPGVTIEQREGADLQELHEVHPELVRVKYEPNIEELKKLAESDTGFPVWMLKIFAVTNHNGKEFLVIS